MEELFYFKIVENCKVIFQRLLFDKDIETYARKLFHHQGNFMKLCLL